MLADQLHNDDLALADDGVLQLTASKVPLLKQCDNSSTTGSAGIWVEEPELGHVGHVLETQVMTVMKHPSTLHTVQATRGILQGTR